MHFGRFNVKLIYELQQRNLKNDKEEGRWLGFIEKNYFGNILYIWATTITEAYSSNCSFISPNYMLI